MEPKPHKVVQNCCTGRSENVLIGVLDADEIYGPVKKQVQDAVSKLIEIDRDGFAIDRQLVRGVLGIFSVFSNDTPGLWTTYVEDFEKIIFEQTAEYYKCKAAVWIQVNLNNCLSSLLLESPVSCAWFP